MKVELDLYDHATKGDLNNTTCVDALDFAKIN